MSGSWVSPCGRFNLLSNFPSWSCCQKRPERRRERRRTKGRIRFTEAVCFRNFKKKDRGFQLLITSSLTQDLQTALNLFLFLFFFLQLMDAAAAGLLEHQIPKSFKSYLRLEPPDCKTEVLPHHLIIILPKRPPMEVRPWLRFSSIGLRHPWRRR